MSVFKEANLCDCGLWVNGVWEWNLRWRRGLFAWEKDKVSQLLEMISNKRPELETIDIWVWKDSETTTFLVKSAYELLKGDEGEEDYRIKVFPSAHVTAWRLIENKVDSKVNLESRGIGIESKRIQQIIYSSDA